MSKHVVDSEGPQMTSQYGAYAFRAGLARPHARTHAHTRRPISNTYCFSTATMIRESASMLRYTYIVCLVNFYLYLASMLTNK